MKNDRQRCFQYLMAFCCYGGKTLRRLGFRPLPSPDGVKTQQNSYYSLIFIMCQQYFLFSRSAALCQLLANIVQINKSFYHVLIRFSDRFWFSSLRLKSSFNPNSTTLYAPGTALGRGVLPSLLET